MGSDGGKEIWDSLWADDDEIDENNFFTCVVQAVEDNLNCSIVGAKILEAGAGTGTSSYQLAKKGAEVTLVDYSEHAIVKAQRMFKRNNMKAGFLCNDIRNMEIEDNQYDVVFNSGVLEHFDYNEQVKILAEMTRVSKPNGLVITMTPNAKCLLYRTWKWILESQNQWPWGEEIPVATMRNQYREAGLNLISEYSIGFDNALVQFGSIRELQLAAHIVGMFYQSIPNEDKNLFEGYLLCSVGQPLRG